MPREDDDEPHEWLVKLWSSNDPGPGVGDGLGEVGLDGPTSRMLWARLTVTGFFDGTGGFGASGFDASGGLDCCEGG